MRETLLNKDGKIDPKDLPSYSLPRNDSPHHMPFRHLEYYLKDEADYCECDIEEVLNPDFQRGHVWSEVQQVSYLEHLLKGGITGKDIYMQCKGWDSVKNSLHPKYCVDGLQRITAARKFIAGELIVFEDIKYSDFKYSPTTLVFIIHEIDFQKHEEVLDWYITLNSSGIAHTEEELSRVRKLKENL